MITFNYDQETREYLTKWEVRRDWCEESGLCAKCRKVPMVYNYFCEGCFSEVDPVLEVTEDGRTFVGQWYTQLLYIGKNLSGDRKGAFGIAQDLGFDRQDVYDYMNLLRKPTLENQSFIHNCASAKGWKRQKQGE